MFLIISLTVFVLILGQNVYDSLYTPVFFPKKINVAEVKKRIQDAGLIPKEALYYEVMELDTRKRKNSPAIPGRGSPNGQN